MKGRPGRKLARLVRKTEEKEPGFFFDVRRIAALAADVKAINVAAYDLRGLTSVTDGFVMCSASSEPQFKAIFRSVKEGMKEVGISPLHTEGSLRGGWLVMDYGDVVLHLFREEARQYYDLDGLWGDAPRIELGLDDQ